MATEARSAQGEQGVGGGLGNGVNCCATGNAKLGGVGSPNVRAFDLQAPLDFASWVVNCSEGNRELARSGNRGS